MSGFLAFSGLTSRDPVEGYGGLFPSTVGLVVSPRQSLSEPSIDHCGEVGEVGDPGPLRALRPLESVEVLDILSSRSSDTPAVPSAWAAVCVARGMASLDSPVVAQGRSGGSSMAGRLEVLTIEPVPGSLGTGVGDWARGRVGGWGSCTTGCSCALSSAAGVPSHCWRVPRAASSAVPVVTLLVSPSGSVGAAVDLGAVPVCGVGGCFQESSSAMSTSSSSVSESNTSSTVVGLAKSLTIGAPGPFLRPLSHRKASSCQSFLTLTHFHSQSRVMNPD